MKSKMVSEYFRTVDSLNYTDFMVEYAGILKRYSEKMEKAIPKIQSSNYPARHYMFLMRGLSIDLDKLGRIFRKKSLKFEKIKYEYKKGRSDTPDKNGLSNEQRKRLEKSLSNIA